MPILTTIIAALFACMTAPALGQDVFERDRELFQSPARFYTPVRDLEPVEQTVEDVDPLARSIRRIERGLRQPTGFESVYRLPGDHDRFMRIDGGLYAVFPRSVYLNTRMGEVPLIPANTVFWIGPPPFLETQEPAGQSRDESESLRSAFVLRPDAMQVGRYDLTATHLPALFHVDDAFDVPSPDELQQMRRRSQLRPQPDNTAPRLRRRDPPLVLPDALIEDDEPSAEEREQFRQRMHELLRRAAEAESELGRRSQ